MAPTVTLPRLDGSLAPFIHDFYEGAKGVQLAELGLKSWAERRWLDVPALPTARAATQV
jgi:hypothetical protein